MFYFFYFYFHFHFLFHLYYFFFTHFTATLYSFIHRYRCCCCCYCRVVHNRNGWAWRNKVWARAYKQLYKAQNASVMCGTFHFWPPISFLLPFVQFANLQFSILCHICLIRLPSFGLYLLLRNYNVVGWGFRFEFRFGLNDDSDGSGSSSTS